jgi:HrpA-like RNA helicase
MSATLDAGKFQTYFDGAPLLKVCNVTLLLDIIYPYLLCSILATMYLC